MRELTTITSTLFLSSTCKIDKILLPSQISSDSLAYIKVESRMPTLKVFGFIKHFYIIFSIMHTLFA